MATNSQGFQTGAQSGPQGGAQPQGTIPQNANQGGLINALMTGTAVTTAGTTNNSSPGVLLANEQAQSQNAAQSSGYAPGFQASSLGAGWAYNPSTGQQIPINNPQYQALLGGGTPAPSAPATPATPTTPAATSSAASQTAGYPPGWQASPLGPSFAYNPSTGQELPINNPTYQSLLSQANNTPSPTTGPSAPAGTPSTTATADTSGTTASGQQTVTNGANGLQISDFTSSPAMQDTIKKLTGIADQSTNIDPNDPVIKQQTDAYNAAQTTQLRNAENAAAEQNGPYASGADATTNRMMTEQAAQNTAGYQGQLMQQELTSRRDMIQNALSTMGGLLSTQDQEKLQTALGNLNSALSQKQMGIQQTEFGQSLAQQNALAQLQAALSQAGLSQQGTEFNKGLIAQLLALAQQGGEFGQSLNQNESQFLDSLGLNISGAQNSNFFNTLNGA